MQASGWGDACQGSPPQGTPAGSWWPLQPTGEQQATEGRRGGRISTAHFHRWALGLGCLKRRSVSWHRKIKKQTAQDVLVTQTVGMEVTRVSGKRRSPALEGQCCPLVNSAHTQAREMEKLSVPEVGWRGRQGQACAQYASEEEQGWVGLSSPRLPPALGWVGRSSFIL